MTAETAKQIGLISEVLEDDALIEKALWLAESIAAQPPIAVQASLRAIWAANDLGRLGDGFGSFVINYRHVKEFTKKKVKIF